MSKGGDDRGSETAGALAYIMRQCVRLSKVSSHLFPHLHANLDCGHVYVIESCFLHAVLQLQSLYAPLQKERERDREGERGW